MSRRRRSSIDLHLDPETRNGILVLCLFAFALFVFLARFGMAGSVGRALDEGLSYIFGWDLIVLPIIFIAWGYYLIAPTRLPIRVTNVIGIALFYLTMNPLVHLLTFPKINEHIADGPLAAAGGKLGETVAVPLVNMMGMAGTVVLLGALFLVSLLLIFNATLQEILFVFSWLWKGVLFVLKAIVSPLIKWQDRRVIEKATQPIASSVPSETVSAPAVPVPAPTHAVKSEDEEEGEEEEGEEEDDDEEKIEAKPKKKYPKIEIPFDLLERRDQKPNSGDVVQRREMIRSTFDKFGIPVEMAEVAIGPTVTQFSLRPADGVKLTRITALHNDLALALAAHPIRIEAPIPGKSLVGIEVPNQSVATVGMREILESKEFRERKSSITFALGKDVAGKPWVADLHRMPHLLVAGATGSGKSVCLNTLIMSFLFANSPDEVKFVMVDPKRVELQIYNGIPHLITPVITQVKETVNALKHLLGEMDRRYDLLSKFGVRDLATYNARVEDKLPIIVVVIDELADLMVTAAQEVEGPIVRLCQMSRAVGIHLVLATQRPSVDVITGLIKANIPARIAFAVASQMDSRTILDQQGAEKLLGRGDMLLSTAEMSSVKRIQGCFVSEKEIQQVVDFIKSHYEPADYDLTYTERPSAGGTVMNGSSAGDDDGGDDLYEAAIDEIRQSKKASTTFLQRRLGVGYARAARLMDILERKGVIGPGDGAKPRAILLDGMSSAAEDGAEEGEGQVEEESL
ncbi:MAG: DNA translocase FtsK 4TM domain-containing protein [Patescibacteria group bacterium]